MRRLILAAAAAAAAVLPAAALAGPAAPEVPAGIAVPDGHKPYLVAHAEGVQIYECTPSAAWRLVAPRATLSGDNGKVIGSHYAGPRWETRDGSIVAGARDAGASVDPTAVDWLRLKAGSTTDGRLAATTYIQRIHTVGGLAPAAADCSAGSAGEQREIPYSADYVFFKATGS
jgi:uncharacterized protein DUF3455